MQPSEIALLGFICLCFNVAAVRLLGCILIIKAVFFGG